MEICGKNTVLSKSTANILKDVYIIDVNIVPVYIYICVCVRTREREIEKAKEREKKDIFKL